MWTIIELAFILGIVLISITEFFYPLLTGKPLFGSFRKTKNTKEGVDNKESLNEDLKKAKQKVDEVKDIQRSVNEKFKSAEQLKKEADDLLK